MFAADAYFISRLPSEPRLSDILLIVVGSFGLCLLSTLYPAFRASRTSLQRCLPVDTEVLVAHQLGQDFPGVRLFESLNLSVAEVNRLRS